MTAFCTRAGIPIANPPRKGVGHGAESSQQREEPVVEDGARLGEERRPRAQPLEQVQPLGPVEASGERQPHARLGRRHVVAKPYNYKDTRALLASYLAAGQAARVAELELATKVLSSLDLLEFGDTTPIQASAVVTLEDDDGAATTFFMAPHGGGVKLDLDGATVQVVTPQSPLGKALLGRTKGDVIELRAKAGLREMTVVDVW